MKVRTPPYLNPGDTIGIVCPAGYMSFEKAAECVRILQNEWGYNVKTGSTLGGSSETYFSGTDEERLADFQQMMDDDEVSAILCGRGGYGMGRIIDRIRFKQFRKKPKWVIGFSDITLFHCHVYSNYRVAGLHAPMAAAFNDAPYCTEYIQSLKDALEGKPVSYHCKGNELNRSGEAKGELVGGNLSLLINSIGTSSEPKTKNRILFIEDVGEQKYAIDRMMYQLKRSGKLDHLAGLIVGGFTDIRDTERPFGEDVHRIILNMVAEYRYPVCFDFPVSHGKENFALKTGVKHHLRVTSSDVLLEE